MNDREQQIYNAIQCYTFTRGYPPTVRELGDLVGLSSASSVHKYLVKIKRQGYITFEPGQPRTLRVVRPL